MILLGLFVEVIWLSVIGYYFNIDFCLRTIMICLDIYMYVSFMDMEIRSSTELFACSWSTFLCVAAVAKSSRCCKPKDWRLIQKNTIPNIWGLLGLLIIIYDVNLMANNFCLTPIKGFFFFIDNIKKGICAKFIKIWFRR